MADIQLIMEVVGEQDMVKAINTAERMEREYKKLDKQLNKGKMSAQQYARGIAQLDAKYDALTKTTDRLTTATKQSAAAQALAGKRINRMGANLQQVGYQVGDFAVQVQGGTNVMVALGQQGAQLLGIFGAGGALAGAALAISTALIAPMMRAKKEVESLRKEFDDLLQSIEQSNAVRGAGGQVALKIAQATSELIAVENKIRRREEGVAKRVKGRKGSDYETELNRLLALTKLKDKADYDRREALILQLRLMDAQRSAQKALSNDQSLEAENLRANEQRIRDERIAANARERALDAAGDKAILDAQAKAEKALFDENAAYEKRVAREVAAAKKREADLDAAGDKAILEAQAKAEKELYEQNAKYAREQAAAAKATSEEIARGYQNSIGLSQTLNNEINSYIESAAEGFKQSEALKEELGEAAFEALRLAGVDMASGISAAHAAAAAMAAELNISLAAAMAIRAMAADEDAVMSQPVVQGKATDRYGVEDLKRFGYTEEYLKSVGKVKTKSGGGKTVVNINEIIEARKKQAQQERVLIGLSGEQEALQRVYFDLLKQNENADIKLTDTELKGAAAAIAAYEEQNRVLEEAVQIQEDIATSIANNFGDAFMSIVDGTKTAKEAFKDMARAIIKDLFRILVVEQMVKSVKGFFGFADGGAFSGGSQIQAYANGGVVGGPTFFPMAGGKTGLMGEAGPEAIMPLKRGPNGKLGVQAEGSSQGNVVVNQSFNFQANGDDSVKKLIAQAAPQIANMTQKQIMDSRRRGGSMKAAFG